MTKANAYEKSLKEFNRQLVIHKIIVKNGAIVDASVIDTPIKPKGRLSYEVVQDRSEGARSQEDLEKETEGKSTLRILKPSVDTDASWIKKAEKLRYSYKKHHVTDENVLVLGMLTTPANVNEITNLEEVSNTADLSKGTIIYGDKGYQSAKNETLPKEKELKSRILNNTLLLSKGLILFMTFLITRLSASVSLINM